MAVTPAAVMASESRSGCGDTVLAVRHCVQNPDCDCQAEALRWRENHHQAAVRELREEVGVTLDPAQLRLVALSARVRLYLYEARVEAMPELVIDRREIIEARFVSPILLQEMRHWNKVGAYLRYRAMQIDRPNA